MTPGEYLRFVRLGRGLSFRELAKRSRLDAGTLCDVEKGRKTLLVSSWKRVAKVIGPQFDMRCVVCNHCNQALRPEDPDVRR